MNKHKHVDRLIVRTVKTQALIPNLMWSKDLKHKRNKFLEKEAKNWKQRNRRIGIGDMQNLQYF